MTDRRLRRVFLEMVREEWRLHSTLFRGGHFALFPALIGALAAGGTALLVATGTDPATVFAGLHALVFAFGLHTGSIGLVGRDALQGLLGDVTLLVFSARTLPLSQSRLLGVFVLKDLVYYSLLFVAPLSVGAGVAIIGVAAGAVRATTVPFLWVTLSLSFVLGMVVTIASLGLARRGVPGVALLAVGAGSLGAAIAAGFPVLIVTPYGLFLDPTPLAAGATILLLSVVSVVGVAAFDPTTRRRARTVGPSFRRWLRRLGDPVATKTVLDVSRSSGGVLKVLFSAAVLLAVTASLVELAGQITGVSPSTGISYGAILGLSGFTTYNWLTQFDDVDSYLAHPLDVAALFRAKFRAFLLFGPLVGIGFYAVAVLWWPGPVAEALVGAVLLVGVACYIFGTTVYLTGLSPSEFLFDSVLFGVFGLAMIVPLVPVLVVGFALAPVSPPLLAALGLGGVVLGAAGVFLYRRSVPKWSRRYRQA